MSKEKIVSEEKSLCLPGFSNPPCMGLFDSSVDRRSVDQVGFVNLRQAFVSGSIPGNASYLDERCNGVVDPDDMMRRPKDNFERMRQASYVRAHLRAAADDNSKQSTPPTGGDGTE